MLKGDFKGVAIGTIIGFVVAFLVFVFLNNRLTSGFGYFVLAVLVIAWVVIILRIAFEAGTESSWGFLLGYAILFIIEITITRIISIPLNAFTSERNWTIAIEVGFILAIPISFIIGWIKERLDGGAGSGAGAIGTQNDKPKENDEK